MQWLSRVSVQRPVFATVLMLLIFVVGAVGYTRLGLDQFPNVDIPYVVVTTRLPGAAPSEMETEVTDCIEGAVNTIGGIDELRSVSTEGVSQVIIQFGVEKDGHVAAQEVRDRVNAILADLPRGIEQPVISKVDPDAASILLIAVRGDAPIGRLTEVADRTIRRQIESVAGVGQVSLLGGRRREISVWLDPAALRASGLTAVDVQRALATQNVTIPAGSLEAGPTNVTMRVDGRVPSPEALGRIILRQTEGRTIRVGDVARVEDGGEQESTWAQLDGERTVILAVRKQSGQNTVTVVDAVNERLREVRRELPADVRLDVIRDNSEVVRTGIDAVKEHLVVGAILATIVVLAFLGSLRSTVIAALSIPISVVGTFGAMWIAGFTLNFMTLLALALSIGIVIDDAIVVLENIVRFIDEKGMKPFPAAVLATREIGLAVLATTLSLMAVFLPVGFMPGLAGRFFRQFGFTMAFAVAVSMLVSFSLTPALASRWLRRHDGSRPFLSRVFDAGYSRVEHAYLWLLRGSLKRRWAVVLVCGLSLGSCVPIMSRLPSGFLPPDDQAQFEINLRCQDGTSLDATRLIAERVAADVSRLSGVERTLLTIGEGNAAASNVAKIYVMLTDPRHRGASQVQIMQRARDTALARLPEGVRGSAGEVQPFSTGSSAAAIQMSLQGPDLETLSTHGARIMAALRRVPGAVDVDDTLPVGRPEVRVTIDRERAGDLGVDVATVSELLRLFVGGLKVSSYSEDGEEFEVRVRADARFRSDPSSLSLLSVPSANGGSVPLTSIVRMTETSGPAEIHRLGRRREVGITANAAPGVGDSTVQAALERIIEAEQLPAGYSARKVGAAKEQARAASAFLLVTAMSFIFMYLVLAAQFESWLHPITILLSLPLTVPFALLSLLVFGQTLNLFSGLGLLVLFGVVKKNAILQIDHTNHLRAKGMDRLEAIVLANKDRLRPILMTTLAFVVGMIPLLTSRGVGAAQNQTTGALVLGGQSLSLLLTLLAVPVAYSLFDDASQWIKRRFARAATDSDEQGARELVELLRTDRLPPEESPGAASLSHTSQPVGGDA